MSNTIRREKPGRRPEHRTESKPARKATNRKGRGKAKAALKAGRFDDAVLTVERGTEGWMTH